MWRNFEKTIDRIMERIRFGYLFSPEIHGNVRAVGVTFQFRCALGPLPSSSTIRRPAPCLLSRDKLHARKAKVNCDQYPQPRCADSFPCGSCHRRLYPRVPAPSSPRFPPHNDQPRKRKCDRAATTYPLFSGGKSFFSAEQEIGTSMNRLARVRPRPK